MADRNESQQEKHDRQDRGALPNERVHALLERIAELEVAHQVDLLRALVGKLSDEERARLIRELEPTGELQ